MREEFSFYLIVALVGLVGIGVFKVVAAGPVGQKVTAIRRFDDFISTPVSATAAAPGR